MRGVSIIVAVAEDGAIGAAGDLAFHLKGDMRHFKEVTMGKPVIMGRKTFESLPKGALPGRRNVVISRNPGYQAAGAETAHSLEEALALTADAEERMIIGGAQIYAQAMPLADRIYLTRIMASRADADTFFPEIDSEIWKVEEKSEIKKESPEGIGYRFIELGRRE